MCAMDSHKNPRSCSLKENRIIMFITKVVSLFRIASVLAAATCGLWASGATVPFKGSLEGHYTSVPGENPTTLVASGNASHLGRFSYSFLAELSPDASTA